MREWHLENMKKTIVKYVGGLSEDDVKSKYKVKLHKLDNVLNDPSFSDIRKKEGSKERIAELQVI
jgi:hypothetical protein